MSDDGFSNYPRSITEIKSDKTDGASDWSPRDALIATLRELDSGRMNPAALVVLVAEGDLVSNVIHSRFFLSSPSPYITMGLIELSKQQILRAADKP